MTEDKNINADKIIALLNELVKLDPEAMHNLMEFRTPCNPALRKHPTVQTTKEETVGLLGILNGIVGTNENGWGYIVGEYDDNSGKLIKFFRRKDADGFGCCGGNDEHPPHHCSDCPIFPWTGEPPAVTPKYKPEEKPVDE